MLAREMRFSKFKRAGRRTPEYSYSNKIHQPVNCSAAAVAVAGCCSPAIVTAAAGSTDSSADRSGCDFVHDEVRSRCSAAATAG